MIGGTSFSRISRDFDVRPDAIRRHMTTHVAPALREALRDPEGLAASGIAARVLAIADDAHDTREASAQASPAVALRAGDAELRALTYLTDRLSVKSEDFVRELDNASAFARAVVVTSRLWPETGARIAETLTTQGHLTLARELEQALPTRMKN
ncbi:DUF1116 domain-containing protein [Clavibacter michiganensis]|uniref:DUF1116 domain-containing protein n=1 Tax=Clavibacter michiganensis TaxID=28447 RepID=UPI0011B0127C|nr:DUF1116 domain-containing protein [Clavibacter michiganensis]